MKRDANVRRSGLFGSYATGRYGPGSDLDILLIIRESTEPRWFMRTSAIDTAGLQVGADLFIYTEEESRRLEAESPWYRHILKEIIWFA
jgi:predicted nucleotidyltransferase